MAIIRSKVGKDGPIVNVTVWVGPEQAEEIIRSGRKVPPPVTVRGLIDTGADCSAIDMSFANSIGLNSDEIQPIQSSAQGVNPIDAPIYEINISFGSLTGRNRPEWQDIRAVGVSLIARDCLVLIGRDMLATSLLIYEGIRGDLIVSY